MPGNTVVRILWCDCSTRTTLMRPPTLSSFRPAAILPLSSRLRISWLPSCTLHFRICPASPVRSIWIAQQKAFTAVRMGMSTAAFLERLRKDNLEAGWFGEGLVALPGGNVVKDAAGEIVGAVGISGLAAHEDQVIADGVA